MIHAHHLPDCRVSICYDSWGGGAVQPTSSARNEQCTARPTASRRERIANRRRRDEEGSAKRRTFVFPVPVSPIQYGSTQTAVVRGFFSTCAFFPTAFVLAFFFLLVRRVFPCCPAVFSPTYAHTCLGPKSVDQSRIVYMHGIMVKR